MFGIHWSWEDKKKKLLSIYTHLGLCATAEDHKPQFLQSDPISAKAKKNLPYFVLNSKPASSPLFYKHALHIHLKKNKLV